MSEGPYKTNFEEEEKGRIEEMQEKLYSRTEEIKHKDRTQLHPKKIIATEDWEGNEEALRFKKPGSPHRASLYTMVFAVSLTFFVVTGALAAYMLLNKKQDVSPDNVSISIFGPVSIVGGEVLSLQVLIENKNSVALQTADLLVEFPEGARYSGQSDRVLERFHKTLGVIAAGEIRTETVKAVLLGGEKDVKNMTVTSNYQIEGSDAKFSKNKEYAVRLTTAPLGVKTQLLAEATAGQEVTLSADVESHSPSSLKGALLQIDYPEGFVYESAAPAPSFDDNIWKLGNMELGESRHIEIKGIIRGENAQEKVFRVYAGVAKNENSPAFDTIFSSTLPGLVIKKPFLGVDIAINGDMNPNYVFERGLGGNIDILWKNNLPDKIIDGEITASVKGPVINRNTITSQDGGFYDSSNDTLFWDERTSASLKTIPPGEKSRVGFSLALLPLVSSNNTVFRNPEIEITVSVKGKRISENNVPEEINSFVTKKYKVATNLQFTGRSVYFVGPFPNSGALPPKVQNETTYTIIWTIHNASSDVSNGVVKAVLPPGVQWKDLVSPNGANLTYNPVSHQIIWNIGKVKTGTGYEIEPQEVSFQVGLTPGLGQVGKTPAIISETKFTGKDDWSGVSIERVLTPLSTMLSTDPQFTPEQSMVVQ